VILRDWLAQAAARLSAAGVESAPLEAQLLAAHVLRVDRSFLFAHPGHDFPELAGESLLQRRAAQEPLAYILGRREFYGRDFQVDRRALIPRQETEILVEAALRHSLDDARVLDVGTGSGCIACTLKLERPSLEVIALDVSPDALEVAQSNAEQLGAEVSFVVSDLFAGIGNEVFDLIVTNPPYIGRSEPLSAEVARHEPELALYGGAEGDELLRRLAREAPAHLTSGGILATEVGYRQASVAREIFEEQGWAHVETVPDLGGIPRVVVLRRS
jgi:release factor glutamine methyltransferase